MLPRWPSGRWRVAGLGPGLSPAEFRYQQLGGQRLTGMPGPSEVANINRAAARSRIIATNSAVLCEATCVIVVSPPFNESPLEANASMSVRLLRHPSLAREGAAERGEDEAAG